MNDGLRTGQEVAEDFNRETAIEQAVNLRDDLMNNYRSNSFNQYFVFSNDKVKGRLNATLLSASQDLISKCKVAIRQEANSSDHDFTIEVGAYRTAFLSEAQDKELFPNDNYSPEEYRNLLKRNVTLREAVACQRASQLFMFLLDLIVSNSKAYAQRGTLQSRTEVQEDLAKLKRYAGIRTPGASTTGSGSSGAPTSGASTAGSGSSGTPTSGASSTTSGSAISINSYKRFFDHLSFADSAVLITDYVSSVTGKEPFEDANRAAYRSANTPVTFGTSNNETLQSLTQEPETFENFAAMRGFITETVKPPTALNTSGLSNILRNTAGLMLEGVGLPSVPADAIRRFFTRVAALPEKLTIKSTIEHEYSSLHLLAVHLLESGHSKESINTFLFQFNITHQELQSTITDLESQNIHTLSSNAQSLFKEVKTVDLTRMRQARSQAVSQFLERAELEEFQSSAGNIIKSPRKLALIYGVLGSGISALNAFLQSLSELIKNKGNILKNPGEFWKSVLRFYIFKKIFNKAFSLLGGIPALNEHEKSFADKFLSNLTDINQMGDVSKHFKKDQSLPRESIFQFYITHESQHGDFIKSNQFIRFMKELFVDDQGNPQTVESGSARVNQAFIEARIEQHANTLTGTAKTNFETKAKALFADAIRTTGDADFGCIQFSLLSISLRAARISSDQDFNNLINRHQQ